MPIVINNVLGQIRTTAASGGDRAARAKRLAEMIQKLGDYRWVGIYDVSEENVSIIAWSGPGAPEHPTFPVSQGLTGAAIQEKRTVISGDVRNDPRYLTAFGSTLSEIIVPVVGPTGGRVIGTVDVESERANAFSASDQQMIEQCAQAALPLWLLR
ncbi:MAG TPA: GAF domain-containing protein [Candidatus Polarisedimenticolia bacterium]|nr:GAF domain-containing protein [Candidatus Polarisedimenticolia bacterium]